MVVDLGFLGDSVHLAPALWELRRHYGQATLEVLSAPVGAEVMRMVPCVDRAWSFPLGSPSPPWWRHWDILRALRREKYDLAFNFSGADRTIFITAWTGAMWRVAHEAGRRHFWNSWLIAHWVPRQNPALPVYEQRRQVLAACGLTLGQPRFDLRIPAEASQWAAAAIPAGAIHFSINASTLLKEWPVAHWSTLAKILLKELPTRHLVATASGKAREQDRVKALAAQVNHPRLIITAKDLTVPQLAGALSRCALHAGGDSGVLHLAAALGLPTVSLFREYRGRNEWLPRGNQHRYFLAPCPCETQKRPDCLARESAACLAQISPDQVARAICEQLR